MNVWVTFLEQDKKAPWMSNICDSRDDPIKLDDSYFEMCQVLIVTDLKDTSSRSAPHLGGSVKKAMAPLMISSGWSNSSPTIWLLSSKFILPSWRWMANEKLCKIWSFTTEMILKKKGIWASQHYVCIGAW